jgi:hypothetical protein
MAQKIFISAFLFLVLIFSQETQRIEGRRLLVGKNNEFENLQTQNKIFDFLIFSPQRLHVGNNSEIENHQTNSNTNEIKETVKHDGKLRGDDSANEAITKESPPTPPAALSVSQPPPPPRHDVDDFRPTAPGHSPGVGHSIKN